MKFILKKYIYKKQLGFTLLEVLVSISILAIALTPFMKSITTQGLLRNKGSIIELASVAAQDTVDKLKLTNINLGPAAIAGSKLDEREVNIDGLTFEVRTFLCPEIALCSNVYQDGRLFKGNSFSNKAKFYVAHLKSEVYFRDELLYENNYIIDSSHNNDLATEIKYTR